jgi:hypothetical protein
MNRLKHIGCCVESRNNFIVSNFVSGLCVIVCIDLYLYVDSLPQYTGGRRGGGGKQKCSI